MSAKKIVVVCGGGSAEREVSLKSGRAVYEALLKSYKNVECLICYDKKNCLKNIEAKSPDTVFIALHGGWGENGELQAGCDMLGIRYIGSDFSSSAACMDKFITKSILKNIGIPVAKAALIEKTDDLNNVDFIPVCIKPNNEGSSIGVEFAYSREELKSKSEILISKFKRIIVEEKIDGRELTVSILDSNVLPIIEIKPKKGFYNYENKYTPGSTQYIVPAENIDKNIENLCADAAYRSYKILGCAGAARVDIILQDNVPFVLEVNTIPGMTETSLLPKAASCAGINFENLVKRMVDIT